MSNYLAWGTSTSPSLTHLIPMSALSDPIGYLETDGQRYIVARGGDETRVRELGFELLSLNDLGWRELQDSGVGFERGMAEMVLRACRALGVREVSVPDDIALSLVEHLRANGVDAQVDAEEFLMRRRRKTPQQIAGIRRAQGAAIAAAEHVRERIHAQGPDLSVEALRQEMLDIYAQHGSEAHWDFLCVAVGARGSDGMDPGAPGPVPAGEPVLFDASPRDYRSGMWGDICRVFVAGDPSPELVRWRGVILEALDASKAAVGPGLPVDGPHLATLDLLEAAGVSTLRTLAGGRPLGEYRYTSATGHGVGFELHEAPHVSEWGATETFVVGDVVAIEPAVYKPGEFGVRFEDVLLVTDDGYEQLGSMDYDF